MATKQTSITANPARHLVFFEGDDLVYNYKTQQWSRAPAYDGYGLFSVNNGAYDIGLVVYSSGSVDLQEQQLTDVAQTATLATGSADLNPGGRAVVNGVRPLINGGTTTVQVGTQDSVSDSVNWSTSMSLNSRTGFANFREEGRYLSTRLEVTGGFTTLKGADVEYSAQGKL